MSILVKMMILVKIHGNSSISLRKLKKTCVSATYEHKNLSNSTPCTYTPDYNPLYWPGGRMENTKNQQILIKPSVRLQQSSGTNHPFWWKCWFCWKSMDFYQNHDFHGFPWILVKIHGNSSISLRKLTKTCVSATYEHKKLRSAVPKTLEDEQTAVLTIVY